MKDGKRDNMKIINSKEDKLNTYKNDKLTMLTKINDILYDELKRLDALSEDDEYFDKEITRSNAMSKNAQTMMNVVKTNIQVIESSLKTNKKVSDLNKQLGLVKEDE